MRMFVGGIEIIINGWKKVKARLDEANAKLDRILLQQTQILANQSAIQAQLSASQARETAMADEVKNLQDSLDELQATTEAEAGQENSIIALVTGMGEILKDLTAKLDAAIAAGDPVAIAAATAAIKDLSVQSSARAAALAAAAAANPLPDQTPPAPKP